MDLKPYSTEHGNFQLAMFIASISPLTLVFLRSLYCNSPYFPRFVAENRLALASLEMTSDQSLTATAHDHVGELLLLRAQNNAAAALGKWWVS